MGSALSQEEYVRQVLESYRKTPGTTGTIRSADRLLAEHLYERGLSVRVIENALGVGCRTAADSAGRCAAARHGSLAGLLSAGD